MSRNIPRSAEDRTREIIDAYGTCPAQWPTAEREATLESLAHSQPLQAYRAQHEDLDRHLADAQALTAPTAHEVQALQRRILASLPAQGTRSWRWPGLPEWLNPPRLALAGIGILALMLVSLLHYTPGPAPGQPDSGYEAWTWYDITGQELSGGQTSAGMSMTEFIDLDEPEQS